MSQIQFLNIDLDIESSEDLSLLVKEIGSRATVMRDDHKNGKHIVSFETTRVEENEIVQEFKSIIDGLSLEAKKLWDKCDNRSFDIGYESGNEPNDFHSTISKKSVSYLHSLGGEVVITIYPSNDGNT